MVPWWLSLSWASTKIVYFHALGITRARNFWLELVTCLYSNPHTCMKRWVSCWGAFLFDKHLDIHLQKGSVFCICRRACSLSPVRDFGVGSIAFVTSGVTSGCGCEVEVSKERCWHIWLLVWKAGPLGLVADSMLISAGLSWGNSTRHKRQSAALLHAPEVHLKVML